MTQPTGTDPSQEMMRQIIGIFDEYTSKENGKNVTRAMKENAKQGFWNGASAPLGYSIVEAERRGWGCCRRIQIDRLLTTKVERSNLACSCPSDIDRKLEGGFRVFQQMAGRCFDRSPEAGGRLSREQRGLDEDKIVQTAPFA